LDGCGVEWVLSSVMPDELLDEDVHLRFLDLAWGLGLIIAENFLKKLGYSNFVRHLFSRYYRKGPDLKAEYANEAVVFEVKISRGFMIDLKYYNAIGEIDEHIHRKYFRQVEKYKIKKFGVIIIGLPLSMDIPINAIIYYNTWKVEAWKNHFQT